jgi:dTDP-4-dehydrorhamnose 3,5-epimerase
MMIFKFTRLKIADVILIEHEIFQDARGFFLESYKQAEFQKGGIVPALVQDNHSRSSKGVLRGLHYQTEPAAIGKLVRCLSGRIFDVAVDIRKGSPTYGKWVGEELSEQNRRMLWIPPGFAHAFVTLSDSADVFYKMSGYYSAPHDRAILWNDPDLAIAWPVSKPEVSAKDAKAPRLKDADNNFVYHEAGALR